VLLLSMYVSAPSALRVPAPGAAPVTCSRSASPTRQVLAQVVGTVAAGGSVVDPELVAPLTARRGTPRVLDTLTEREGGVVRPMAEGRCNRGIAAALCMNLRTVETHIPHIVLELGIDESADDHWRVLAVLRWLGRPA
jgi:DNA-binding NarL/FixJ family response regulator